MDASAAWTDVDAYLIEQLVHQDDAMSAALADTRDAGIPDIEVAPNQGALLSLVCRMVGARRVLELGTLGGYSTIWLARAVGEQGHVTTLELEARHAEVARVNLDRAGVGERVEVLVGPAVDTLERLVAEGTDPYDVVFIDADKANNLAYLQAALRLTRPGSVIFADNVVRGGAVTDAGSDRPDVRGTRALIEAMGADDRLEATALQTVGRKGWDGFAIALVR